MNLSYYLKSPINRIILSLFLLFLLLGLFYAYNGYFEANEVYQGSNSILNNYTEGNTIYIYGSFAGFYSDGFYLKYNQYGQEINFKINSSSKPGYGDIIYIIGTIGSSGIINPQKMEIITKWKQDFVLYRSALILIILPLIFWRYWRFDFKNMEFIRRN